MEKKKKSQSFYSWKIDDADLKNQVDNYNSLKIAESYRGIAVLIYSVLLVFSLLLSFFGLFSDTTSIIFAIIFYIPILFFVYKGHRWAIVILIVMWTYEKGYQLYEIGKSGKGGGIILIFWWLFFMPYFWRALKVENERRKSQRIRVDICVQENQKEEVNDHKEFCSNCGKKVSQLKYFCRYCGNKIIQ